MKKTVAILTILLFALSTFGQDTLTTQKGRYLLYESVFMPDSNYVFSKVRKVVVEPILILPSCNNAGSFDILTVNITSRQFVSFRFNAQNLSVGSWKISNYSGTFEPTSNLVTVLLPTPLTAGDYVFTISGKSCTGTTSTNVKIR